jgi:hypothetical protein
MILGTSRLRTSPNYGRLARSPTLPELHKVIQRCGNAATRRPGRSATTACRAGGP